MFPVVGMPIYVYSAPCKDPGLPIETIRKLIIPPKTDKEVWPFIVRAGELLAFQDLRISNGPFRQVVDREHAQRHLCREWWDDAKRLPWFIELLNRSLHKLTGRRGLRWDRDHKRYYFQSDEPGNIKQIRYRPLNKSGDTKNVVWQPISKRTGLPRAYWLHRAVSLRFHRISSNQWCLSVRPEFRVTTDGVTPLQSEKIGARITRKKSKMFNYDLLGEVNFWRDYLSDGNPRIYIDFGAGQRVIVSTEMMTTQIEWPGIPEKYAKPFKNVEYAETLFTWAELDSSSESVFDPEADDGEDEDEGADNDQ